MPTRLLRYFCKPASIALIGASERPGSIGAVLTRNLLSSGFQGELFLINRRRRIQDRPVWPCIADAPRVPELAIIAVPPTAVAGLLADLGGCGTPNVIIATAAGCRDEAQSWCDIARHHNLRLLGPGSFGVIAPRHGLNASLSSVFPPLGHLALVTSSGLALTPLLEWATAHGIGFSNVIALGDGGDVDFSDMLNALTYDSETRVILLILETLTHARAFLSAARAAARIKPVLAVRVGQGGNALSHPTDAVYAAALRRAGILCLPSWREMFDVAEALVFETPVHGDRLAILGNSREAVLSAANMLSAEGGRLAVFSPATQAALRKKILPLGVAPDNPLDLGVNTDPSRFAAALDIVLREATVDGVLALYASNATTSAVEVAAALIETFGRARNERRPGLLTCWLGADGVREARRLCLERHIPSYDAPDDAVRAFIQCGRHHRRQIALTETPPDLSQQLDADVAAARQAIHCALTAGRNELTVAETQNLLAVYGIAVEPDGTDPLPHSRSALLRLAIRMILDPVFGPVLLFGPSGPAASPDEFSVALPPLNPSLAREAVAGGIGRCLQNAASEAFALLLIKIAQSITDLGEITALDLDPVFVTTGGLIVGAARIEIAAAQEPAHRRLAIRPYPREWEETLSLPDGGVVLIRPVRPEDEPAFIAGFAKLSREDVRMRFMHIIKELTHTDAVRLTQIDYDREMALVALRRRRDGHEMEGCGVARIVNDGDRERAEFAIVLLRDAVGIGLSNVLLRRLMDYARAQGIGELYGEILRENEPMLALCRAMGFTVKSCPDDYGVMIATLKLN